MGNELSIEYTASRVSHEGATFWLQKNGDRKELVVEGATDAVLDAFAGTADGDRFIGRSGVDRTAALVDAPYRLVVLSGVSHWIPTEAPAACAGAILDRVASGPS